MTLEQRLAAYTFWRLDKPGCKYRTFEDRCDFMRWLRLTRLPG